MMCVERKRHFPPEIYRYIAKYVYYKQHWPDTDIRKYNQVMQQLPYPVAATAPSIIYESSLKKWRCCKMRYRILFPPSLKTGNAADVWTTDDSQLSFTEYEPFQDGPWTYGDVCVRRCLVSCSCEMDQEYNDRLDYFKRRAVPIKRRPVPRLTCL